MVVAILILGKNKRVMAKFKGSRSHNKLQNASHTLTEFTQGKCKCNSYILIYLTSYGSSCVK